MGDHELDGVDSPTDNMAPVDPASKRVEAKLVVGTTVAALLYGVLNFIAANTAVLDVLPEPWRALALAIVPALLAFAAGWRTPSNRTA